MPAFLSPSALGAADDCMLKLIAASSRTRLDERLPSGPEAALGTLFHRVFERCARERGAVAASVFDDEYARTAAQLQADSRRAHFSDLAATKSLEDWRRLKSWVLKRADLQVRSEPRASTSGPAGRAVLAGAEIALESTALRLRGKVDRIRQLGPDRFEVTDFKTGATLDDAGEIKDEIALQLRAYGLLLLERRPKAKVRLVVDDGTERDVAFEREERSAARAAIRRIMSVIPPAGEVAAEAIAQPGRACWGCPIRHVCPSYRAAAPVWWKEYPSQIDRLSNDVWGRIAEKSTTVPMSVTLTDDSQRRVRIDGIDPRHGLEHAPAGARVWFFGLEASGACRGFDGRRYHARSFHELPRDRLERRAWSTCVFIEG